MAVEDISDLSSFTRVQFETLKVRRSLLKGEINMDTALKKRKNAGISPGTYYRILAQAKRNLRRSLFSVGLGVQLGLLKIEDVQKFIAAISMVPVEIEQHRVPEVMALVTALSDRIVMS